MKTDTHFIQPEQLQILLDNLQHDNYDCFGPQVRDAAIVFDRITSVEQLPRGISDAQTPGCYSLENNNTLKYFDWANGPQAIKPLLFAPRENLWQSEQSADGQITFKTSEAINSSHKPMTIKPMAIIGARACDVAAMKLQDQHFLQQQFVDPYYQARRENLLIIAVNCGHPADTCFCHSTGDGPFVDNTSNDNGTDIVLTELKDGFIIQAFSHQGEEQLDGLALQKCSKQQRAESETIETNAAQQKRKLPTFDIKSRLFDALDNDAWQAIATKCLSCGNCVAVCPTCFCHSENDAPELDGKTSIHYREWDTCFSQGHSYIHGITIRGDTSPRYRQWLTHKFASWIDQYGRSGCVGCGRCISWCPVGIDVTESLAAFE